MLLSLCTVVAVVSAATLATSGSGSVASAVAIGSDQGEASTGADLFWPRWRGPLASGVGPHADPPVEWSEERNVAWKAPLAGEGSATPVVWQDLIFVQSAVPADEPEAAAETRRDSGTRGARRRRGNVQPTSRYEFLVTAFDRDDGSVVWQRTARRQRPHATHHPTGTWASNSAVTDGRHLVAYFGSHGLYCYDLDGTLLWSRDLGDMEKRLGFGEGSSPALHDGTVVVQWDHEGSSFVVALDVATGEERWRRPRDEITSWATPLIVRGGGRTQVITAATERVRSYDLETGEVIWGGEGLTLNSIPSPVAGDGLVFVTSGFRGNVLRAIRLDAARGDVTGSDAVVWSRDRDTPYVPSPLLYEGRLYLIKSNSGILTSLDAASGDVLYGPVRLDGIGTVYASPVGAAGRVYIVDRRGNAVVLRHGDEYEVMATNSLDDGFDASPVAVDDQLYLRGRRFLYRISGS